MFLSAVSVLVVAQSIFEMPEGLMYNPVYRPCFVKRGQPAKYQFYRKKKVVVFYI